MFKIRRFKTFSKWGGFKNVQTGEIFQMFKIGRFKKFSKWGDFRNAQNGFF